MELNHSIVQSLLPSGEKTTTLKSEGISGGIGVATPPIARPTAPLVVVAFLDGRRPRGYVFDFSPMRDKCKLFPSQTAKAEEGEDVELRKLKAIFFLKEAPGAVAATTPAPPAPPAAPAPANRRKLEVIFADKERLEGTTEGYSKDRQGFFMVPEDPTGRILRVYIINANVKSVKWL